MKSNDATQVCKVCFKEIGDDSLASLTEAYPICDSCFLKMEPKMKKVRIDRWKGYVLYPYNACIRSLIYQFKGCYDYELRSVFLARQRHYLSWRFKGYTIVPAPSHESHDRKRGFNHIEEIFGELSLPIVKALKKTSDVKQSDLGAKERAEVGRRIAFCDGIDISKKKILFVDDILTTGNTAKACMSLLSSHGAKRIRFLILAKGEKREGKKEKFKKASAKLISFLPFTHKRRERGKEGAIP